MKLAGLLKNSSQLLIRNMSKSPKNLPSQYSQFIHLSRYARWLPEEGRRETWEETVGRLIDFFVEHVNETCEYELSDSVQKQLQNAILGIEVVPSMRALWAAGPAAERDEISVFNCSAMPIDKASSFDEMFYILMNGCGAGFSVERQFINQLPEVSESFHPTDTTIKVADSKIGWAKALKELIGMLFVGQIPQWDVTKVRPAGTPLKTFGGRASGPGPLVELFEFCVDIFKNAAGRKLTSLECHDICCKIADVTVSGGVRRSALLSLSNLSDLRMREAKVGRWWEDNPQRALANNSVAYTEKPDMGIFMKEWQSLYDSKSGERGIFSRESCKKIVEQIGRRDADHEFLTNPCITDDTWIDTDKGLIKVKDLIHTPFNAVVHGKSYPSEIGFFLTGRKKVYSLVLESGHEIKCTKDHKILTRKKGEEIWVEAQKLNVNSNVVLNINEDPTNTSKFKSFTPLGSENVYDCTVEEVHRFGANGIVVHNCSEIILRPRGLCNLSEVILREDDTEETILKKIENATILGTIQCTFTNYRYLSKTWKKNAEEERLLGVSMTGIMDCPLTNGTVVGLEERLKRFKNKAIDVNKKWAAKFGIPQSCAITCVKPSGNTSQLCNTSSGIHTRHSPCYIRTVRADKKDPLTKLMIDKGFPYEDEINNPQNIAVFSFPIRAPENSLFRDDRTAIEQLELWKTYQVHWCEHKPSVTVSVKEDEWLEVGAWVYKNFELMSGVSFLPFSNHSYKQAPYQDCSEEDYEELLTKMPKDIDWSRLSDYETSDMTTGSQELSCTAGGCEL